MKKDPSIRCFKCGCFYLKSYLDMYGDGMCRSCGVKTHNELTATPSRNEFDLNKKAPS